MAQLVKLKDYVSRYEQNILLYPSRFVRLKKQKWDGIKKAFETKDSTFFYSEKSVLEDWNEEKDSFLLKIRDRIFKSKKEKNEINTSNEKERIILEEQDLTFQYNTNLYNKPKSLEELKIHFLNQLFQFQMKWASSTLTEKSIVAKALYYEEPLKYYLQRFPDTYLVLYKPIFLLKNAPIELDTILITPTNVWCITILEEEDSAVFVGSNEKFWIKKREDQEKKILSPVITINRTEKIVRSILEKQEIPLPIKKVILTRNGYIDFPSVPYDLTIIEKRNYEDWFKMMRNHRSPFKAVQLKAVESLFQYCLTTSIRRYEWETDDRTSE